MAKQPAQPIDDAALLEKKGNDLQQLIDEGQRVQREVHEHLTTLRRSGDPSAPNKKC